MVRMRARYDGTCSSCGGQVAAGDEIEWDRDARAVYHPGCAPSEDGAAGGALQGQRLVRLHPTAIKTYLRCPRRYEFQYMERIPAPAGGALIKGRAAHRAAEAYLKSLAENGERLPEDAVVEEAARAFEEEWERQEVVLEEGEERGQLKDTALRSASAWYRAVAPGVRPRLVEQGASKILSEAGVELYGRVDCVEVDGRIRDMKNTTRKPDEITSDMQAMAYSVLGRMWLPGGGNGRGAPVRFDFLVEQKNGGIAVEHRDAEFGEADIAFFLNLVGRVGQAVRAGAFPPNPEGWHCSKRFCPYWNRCRVR